MDKRRVQLALAFLLTASLAGCSSPEPYARGDTGYRYNVADSKPRALASVKRWSNPETMPWFWGPKTPYGHRVTVKAVTVTDYSITLSGDRELQYTDRDLQPGSEVIEIPFASIQTIETDIILQQVILRTQQGKYQIQMCGFVEVGRIKDALEMYLPYVL